MKHIKALAAAALLLSAGLAPAAPLSPDEALQRALAETPLHLTPRDASPLRLASTRLTTAGQPALYIFSRKGEDKGFLVVSAGDRAKPLLGYGDRLTPAGESTGAPAFEWWLEELCRRIEETPSADSGELPGEYSIPFRRPERKEIAPLCATRWSQDEPYNSMCPKKGGKQTYTGCVATAMAQVMKYHQWPETGQGSHAYDWGNKNVSANFEKYTYRWADMLDTYSEGEYTSSQGRAVGLLMFSAGVGVDMNYGTSSSGAQSMAIAGALGNYFRYDKSLRYLMRDYYELGEWEEIIYTSLRDDGPVIYDGQSHAGGHSFVCDGYEGDGYFHFNWGWGGVSDGYFLLDALDPGIQGIGGSTSGFNFAQDIIVGIRPDRTGDSQFIAAPLLYRNYSPDADRYALGEEMTWKGFIINPGPAPIERLNLVVELAPADGSERELCPLGTLEDLGVMYGISDFTLAIPEEFPEGEYKVGFLYYAGEVDWSDYESLDAIPWKRLDPPVTTFSYSLRIADGYCDVVREDPLLPEAPDFFFPPKIGIGWTFSLCDLQLVNPHDSPVYCQIAAGLVKDSSLVALGPTSVIDLEEKESILYTYVGTLEAYSDARPGEYEAYLFAIIDNRLISISEAVTVSLTDESSVAAPEAADTPAEYISLDGLPAQEGKPGVSIRLTRDSAGRLTSTKILR